MQKDTRWQFENQTKPHLPPPPSPPLRPQTQIIEMWKCKLERTSSQNTNFYFQELLQQVLWPLPSCVPATIKLLFLNLNMSNLKFKTPRASTTRKHQIALKQLLGVSFSDIDYLPAKYNTLSPKESKYWWSI